MNRRAIKNGFVFVSIFFTSFALILLAIGFFKGQVPELGLFLSIIVGASVVFPIIITSIGLLKGWLDYSVTTKNFNSYPFSNLIDIGFKKMIKNENSKWNLTSEFYNGMVNDFIVDCDVDTQNDYKSVRFIFYINHEPMDKAELNEFEQVLTKANGSMKFTTISKKFHYKNHGLKSISDLKVELANFVKIIKSKNIMPSEVPWR